MRSLILILVLLLTLPSCNLQKRLALTSERIQKRFAKSKNWDQLPLRTITWQQALVIMRANNMDLRTTQTSIDDAKRDKRSVYTNLIPGVTYYGYFSNSIQGLIDRDGSGGLEHNINVTSNLPNITQEAYRVYAAKATEFAAIKAKEGKERELTAKLYNSVRRRALKEKIDLLEQQRPEFTGYTPPQKTSMLNADATYWQEVGDLLGDRSARWLILPSTCPKVSWRKYKGKLGQLDPLVVCQYALTIERARLAQYSVMLNYLPTINTSIYSPSLFSSYGGTYQGTFLNKDDTKINLSIGYTLDTQLRNWNNYKQNREKYEATCVTVSNELMDRKNKLRILRRSVEEYDTWCSFMRKKMDFIKSSSAPHAEDYVQRASTLKDMQLELLRQEESSIETECSLILEYGILN